MKTPLLTLVTTALLMTPFACTRSNADPAKAPAPVAQAEGVEALNDDGKAVAVFAGGCFWCTEAVFERVRGVDTVVSGYAGGGTDDANYEMVSAGVTEHAEAIEITYDPETVSYSELLRVFFIVAHDPTQLNKQGPDHGKQYRSAVFYLNDAQQSAAKGYIEQLDASEAFPTPVVTTLEKLTVFHVAETKHQDYVQRFPNQPYIVFNALPKVEKLEKYLPDFVEDDGE